MGLRIKQLRIDKGMTQQVLAEKSGISRTTINQLEKKSTKATSTKTLLAIAKALDTTIDALFFNESV